MMPGDDASCTEASGSAPQVAEALACVSCRSRKLKCDRTKPACTRCVKVKNECIYPESRRKPAFKRRNVKELEARLAQVEDLLKDVGKNESEKRRASEALEFMPEGADLESELPTPIDQDDEVDIHSAPFMALPDINENYNPSELIALGMSEAPPPFEVIEDLHKIFFQKQQLFIPLIHPGRYLKSFHSAPHLRPPMCLQYAIWAMAANGHKKYESYHDVFYQRARHYLEADELKGHGEHFMTVSHVQAWGLIGTNEARCMMFTRAAMSAARAVRMANMMGLHRLDGPGADDISPTILPPADWTELEERRRIFWGAFCIDSHCSISTGWPALIDVTEVTTHLPSSEEAFNQGKEEKSSKLMDVFNGASYSTFAGAVVMCHCFNVILKHVHSQKPDDRPEDFEYGGFWNRHRELDTMLSSAFMYLPEKFRLPKNIRDPVAVHTNLNLHASVICLHNAALEQADVYKLAPHVKKACQDRLSTAAQEIVNIMKLTSHMHSGYRSPLVALSIYCATSVFVYQAREAQEPALINDLEFLIKCMEAIGREHVITRAFLQQALLDIERNGITTSIKIPWFDDFAASLSPCGHNIPLLARSSISRHSKVQPPLPGRLPLGKPIGNAFGRHTVDCCPTDPWRFHSMDSNSSTTGGEENTGNKRRRMKSPEPYSTTTSEPKGAQCRLTPSPSSQSGTSNAPRVALDGWPVMAHMKLPHRTGSPASSPSIARDSPLTQPSRSTSDTPATGRVETMASDGPSPNSMDTQGQSINLELFSGLENWEMTDDGSMYAQFVEAVRNGTGASPGALGDNLWDLLNDTDGNWNTGGTTGGNNG